MCISKEIERTKCSLCVHSDVIVITMLVKVFVGRILTHPCCCDQGCGFSKITSAVCLRPSWWLPANQWLTFWPSNCLLKITHIICCSLFCWVLFGFHSLCMLLFLFSSFFLKLQFFPPRWLMALSLPRWFRYLSVWGCPSLPSLSSTSSNPILCYRWQQWAWGQRCQ